jgi:hypothetical protein
MTRLSNRQFPMLAAFCDQKNGEYMAVDEAQVWDQRPFRSMLIRNYVAYRPGHGFHITKEGREAMKEFEDTDILRKNPLLPLTSYFDPTAYGLAPRKPKAHKEPAKRKARTVREHVNAGRAKLRLVAAS